MDFQAAANDADTKDKLIHTLTKPHALNPSYVEAWFTIFSLAEFFGFSSEAGIAQFPPTGCVNSTRENGSACAKEKIFCTKAPERNSLQETARNAYCAI